MTSGSTTLFSVHRNDARSSFSFELGLMGSHPRVRNDFDLEFLGDRFRVNSVTDDRSRILDLGAKSFAEIKRVPQLPDNKGADFVPVVTGHCYVVHTRDTESDHFSLFRVTEFVPQKRVSIDWLHWRREAPGPRLKLKPETKKALMGMFRELSYVEDEARRKKFGSIRDPRAIVLQMRTGAQGGNRSHITLRGSPHRMPDKAAAKALDVKKAPDSREEAKWFLRGGGLLPRRKALRIESIDVFARASGDSNGTGEVRVTIGGQRVFSTRNSKEVTQSWLDGVAVVRPGDEDSVRVYAANSSAVEVRIYGSFVVTDDAGAIKPVAFVEGGPDPKVQRAGTPLKPRATKTKKTGQR